MKVYLFIWFLILTLVEFSYRMTNVLWYEEFDHCNDNTYVFVVLFTLIVLITGLISWILFFEHRTSFDVMFWIEYICIQFPSVFLTFNLFTAVHTLIHENLTPSCGQKTTYFFILASFYPRANILFWTLFSILSETKQKKN